MNKKGLLLVTATAIISGFSIFINKFSVDIINPYVFTTLKNSVVALLLVSIILIWRRWPEVKKLDKKNVFKLIIVGLIGGAIPFLLFFKGLSITTAGNSSLIHKTIFIFTAILAFVFLKEKPSKKLLIGLASLLLGTFLLGHYQLLSFNRGDLLIFLAVILWSFEYLLAKKILKNLSGLIVATGRLFFGSLFLITFLIFTGQISLFASLGVDQIGWSILTSIILAGYVLTWYSGLKLLPLSVAGSFLAMGTSITIILSLIFLPVSFGFNQLLGLILMFSGILLIIDIKKIISSLKLKHVSKRTQTSR